MSVNVRSEVVVTSGDIAQALFSKVQQDLVTQRNAVFAERRSRYDAMEAFAKNWLLARFNDAKASKKWADALAWAAYTGAFFNIDFGIEPSINGIRISTSERSMPIVQSLLHISYGNSRVRWKALEPEQVFEQRAEFVIKEDDNSDESENFVFGSSFILLGEFTDAEFCASLNEQFKHVCTLDDELARLRSLIDGEKSKTTGLSVQEQIQAAITMQAVNSVPQLKAAFDIDALTVDVEQLLLPKPSEQEV